MVCQECGERPASLHFTKIVNGEKTEVHLCPVCAQEKNESFINSASAFTVNHLLSGLFNMATQKEAAVPPEPEMKCSQCNRTFQEFLQVGKFGCDHCYEAFENKLDPILKRVHSGNSSHKGKIPQRAGKKVFLKRQVQDLRQNLQQLITNEEFEEAAKVRDEIRHLEKQVNQEGGEK
ncbi:hypothetical protein Q73_14785 [Bacillus coahuilensis m2-6]|uniref:UVR domain-containing protein n=1 Tax=Bacillus coahuilensis p1.1.43 TaxID=1150625 RepID=A0A147K5H7_9BACI|nr:UvrB/UvrC motif-containing protein [Bacillus coahuilensis]KUP04594.1 hypothetical protein Q73_14785 [Bacillus coahuilensis m2-6]KUP04818.1 hypothetical protein Q75_14430 [Bacillus coahuilensis p1.1.43]